MKKQTLDKQSRINTLFLVAMIGLIAYAIFLNYEIATNRSASESVDRSLAEQIFKIQVQEAAKNNSQ